MNSGLAALTLGFGYDYQSIRPIAVASIFLFTYLCWLEQSNILFLARTFILGFIGYFPMIIKVILGQEALFSGYERSTQGFDIVVLMYVITSLALLSNQIGLAFAKKKNFVHTNINPRSVTRSLQKNRPSRPNYWRIAGFIGVILAIFSSYIFIRGYGQTILTAGYVSEEQGGAGLAFGSAAVFGVVGVFSIFVAGMKGYIKNWKIIFFIACLTFILYSQLLMGVRQDAMSTLFGLLILYGVINRREIGLKLSYIPILVVAYIFFEAWGVARSTLAGGIERAFGDNFGVELFERAGGGVARIGKHFLAGGFALGIQFFKTGARQENLLADFEQGGQASCLSPFSSGDFGFDFETGWKPVPQCSVSGTLRMVLRLAVMSSPVVPSPRVAPVVNMPCS